MKPKKEVTATIVREVLERHPEAADCNIKLLSLVWRREGAKLPPLRELRKLSDPGTVLTCCVKVPQ